MYHLVFDARKIVAMFNFFALADNVVRKKLGCVSITVWHNLPTKSYGELWHEVITGLKAFRLLLRSKSAKVEPRKVSKAVFTLLLQTRFSSTSRLCLVWLSDRSNSQKPLRSHLRSCCLAAISRLFALSFAAVYFLGVACYHRIRCGWDALELC